MNLSNLGQLSLIQYMYILQQVKYLVTHQKLARDKPNGHWCPLGRILYTTPKKVTVLCDVYISIIVEISSCPPSSSTDKANTKNNELEELP